MKTEIWLLITSMVIVSSGLLPTMPVQAEEVVFGRFQGGRIGQIVYYRNGEWVQPKSGSSLSYTVIGPGETPADLGYYASFVWGSTSSVFSQWFDINVPNSTTHRFKDAMKCESTGRLGEGTLIVSGDLGKSDPQNHHWVATKTTGYVWRDFQDAFKLIDKSNLKSLTVDGGKTDHMPDLYRRLLDQVKARWVRLEPNTVKGMNIDPSTEEKVKEMLRNTPHFVIEAKRVTFAGGAMTLFHFFGMKGLRSPLFLGDDHEVVVMYRGWALLDSDQHISWPATIAGVGQTYSRRNSEYDYRRIEPISLIEMDKRIWLLANASDDVPEGGVETEVYELVDGKFRARGVFDATCG